MTMWMMFTGFLLIYSIGAKHFLIETEGRYEGVLGQSLRSLTPAGGNQGGDEKRISAKSSKVTKDEKKQTESDSGKGLDD